MSRNAIGHRVNGKDPRGSVVVPEEGFRQRGSTYKCPSSDLSPWNFRILCILPTQYDNYDYDAPESRWRRQGFLPTSHIEGICWFARTVWENLLYSSYLCTSGTLQHKWIIHAATQFTRGQQACLSELVMIKSNIKPQPVGCYRRRMFDWQCRQWQFIDSDDVVLVRTITVWWK